MYAHNELYNGVYDDDKRTWPVAFGDNWFGVSHLFRSHGKVADDYHIWFNILSTTCR